MATTITSRVGGLPIASPAEVQQAKSYAEIARQHAESAESSADAAAESEAAAAASQAAAAESEANAAASAAVASGAMTALLNPIFSTVAAAQSYAPDAAPDYIRTAFYDSSFVVGSGATYRKVETEPSHAGKFSITLSDGNTVVWYEIAEAEVHIAQFGAKMDGVTDDAAAVLAAHGVGRPVRFGPGRIRLASMIEITDHLPIWRGSGRASHVGLAPNATVLVGDHSDAGIIKINTSNAGASRNLTITEMTIMGGDTTPPDDQHGIIFGSRATFCNLSRLVFRDLTGCAIAFETDQSRVYSQNVALRDASFYNVGACLGLTEEPANGADFLACTLLQIHNVNLDEGINPQSPRPYIWDFRAFREISADTFLNEGTGAVGCDVVMAFATDGMNSFRNVHIEFTSNGPEYIAYFYHDNDNKFYAASESRTVFRGLAGGGKFGIDPRVESDIHVIDWSRYGAASIDDILDLKGYGGSIIFERLQVKEPFLVPTHMAGQVEILSLRSMDDRVPFLEQGPVRFARWRPSDGALSSFNKGYMRGFLSGGSSNAVEADDQFSRLTVWRATSAGGGTIQDFNVQLYLPNDWFDTYLSYDSQAASFTVGSILTGGTSGAKALILDDENSGTTGTLRVKMMTTDDFEDDETITDADGGSAMVNGGPSKIGPVITAVMRYRITIDADDEAAGVGVTFSPPASGIVADPDRARQTMGGAFRNDEWRTYVISVRPTQAAALPIIRRDRHGPTPTKDVVFRIASVDFYLGRRWQEPLDLDYV